MTESPFPFGAVGNAAAFDDEPGSDSRRNVIALGALAVVLVGGGAYFLLSGGSDTADDVAFTPAAPRAAANASPSPSALKLPVVSTIPVGRNPFKALYVQPAVVVAAPVGTTPVSTAPDGSATPIVLVSPGDATPTNSPPRNAPTSTGSGPSSAPEPQAKEYRLILRRVFGDGTNLSAVFTVDGKQMTAKVGSTFGPTAEIMLLSLQQGPKDEQWTAVLQVGDGDPFDVVTDQPVFVR